MIFISYSHADHVAAEELAHKLENRGQEVWWDKWDIQAGDSLIQKIFEEGIGRAKAFLILLSKTSVKSKWVREELDQATVRRIEGLTRVIPVLLDDVTLPVPLRTLKWVDFRDGADEVVDEIVHAIEGIRQRPQRGERTPYLTEMPEALGGLSPMATKLGLAVIAAVDLDDGAIYQFEGGELEDLSGLPTSEVNDAVDELEAYGLVRTLKTLGSAPYRFWRVIPTYALFNHFEEFLSYSPKEDVITVLNAVAAREQVTGEQLSDHAGLSPGRLNRAVQYIKDYSLADVLEWMGTQPYSFGEVRATWQTRQHAQELGR